MGVTLDEASFQRGHQIFRSYVEEDRSESFQNHGWDHPYVRDELEYKRSIREDALEYLQLDQWDRWIQNSPARILEAVGDASQLEVSQNLITTGRYPPESIKAPERALEHGGEVAAGVAERLHAWFRQPHYRPFSARFDDLATYLRSVEGLPCRGAWFAYLAFLYDPTIYFPMRPRSFGTLLKEYGNPDLRVEGKITWKRYRHLLQLATLLTDRLAEMPCGEPDTLQVQTYMYVVGSQLLDRESLERQRPSGRTDRSPGELLQQRLKAARRRERRGLKGELHVLQAERQRLREAGRPDLAEQVFHRAGEDPKASYDIDSYTTEGDPRRIEVKATREVEDRDAGFILTEAERAFAREHSRWTLYRVWNVEDEPQIGRLGHILDNTSQEEWELNPRSWRCRPS